MPHRERIRAYLAERRLAATGRAETQPRPRAAVAFTAGTFGVAFAITTLWWTQRAVMDIGGYCAQGGPFVIEDPCPGNTAWLAPVSVWVGLACVALMLWGAAGLDHSAIGLVLLGWPALFLPLGWNFLEYAVDPPEGGGPAIGWFVCAVVFAGLGIPGLLLARGAFRALEGPRALIVGLLIGGAVAGVVLGTLAFDSLN
jgi:hypothetical protein